MKGVLQNALLGGGFAFAAAMQPGPLQAFLLSRVVANGWKGTLPACLSPLLSDGPIALVVLVLLGQLPTQAQHLLRAAGGGLLLVLAWKAARPERGLTAVASVASAPRTLVDAMLVNLLNPNAYLGWALVLGPSAVAAWRESAAGAIALIVAFYVTIVLTLAIFVFLMGAVRLLGPRARNRLAGVSALVLAIVGAFLLVTGVRGLVTDR